MSHIKVSSFVKLVPEEARGRLPADLRGFRVSLMPWLSQVYYEDKLIHYELAKLPSRYGENCLELGLHFESRSHALNMSLLRGFDQYMFEVRDGLGTGWNAEPWDRGWTKVYTTIRFQFMDELLLNEVAGNMTRAISVLEPIFRLVYASAKKRSA